MRPLNPLELLILVGVEVMNYANKYILSRGQECVVERTVSVETRVSIRGTLRLVGMLVFGPIIGRG